MEGQIGVDVAADEEGAGRVGIEKMCVEDVADGERSDGCDEEMRELREKVGEDPLLIEEEEVAVDERGEEEEDEGEK